MPGWWPFSSSQPGSAASTPPHGVPTDASIGECANLDRLNANLVTEFVRSIYLWRCIDIIASMSASVPLIVKKDDQSQLTGAQRNIEVLLQRPNPQWTGSALQYFAAASIAVANKAFLLRVRGAGGITQELWPITPTDVMILYVNGSRMIKAFDVSNIDGSGQSRRFPVGDDGDCDIIYVRRPALNHQTDRSPAAIAAAPAEVFTRVLQRCADIVSNSSNITGLLSTDAEIGKQAVADIKDKISSFRTGSSQSGGTLVTANAKWTLTRLSEDPATALSVEIKDSLARDVCMTFGVPTQLCGLPGQDTYNNLAQARVGMLSDCVLPGYINPYVSQLNHALMAQNGAQIMADIEHVPAMIAFRADLTKTAVQATMLSINEQRAMIGYPPVDDEDADVPVLLETLRLKRLAIEVQGFPGACPTRT